MLLGDRTHPITAPACFSITPGKPPELVLAPGVQLTIGPKELERRFRCKPIKAFFARYREAGGDTRRLETLLTCLLPVKVPLPPPRRTLEAQVTSTRRALEDLLRLPGTLPGREVFGKAADTLRALDLREYLAQFKPDKPVLISVDMYVPQLVGDDYRPQTFVPAIGAQRRGRIRKGSPTGLIIGVLAEECRRRFEAPWWPDILEVCLALAPETFDPKCDTVERLRKRVERVRKDRIVYLHRSLFLLTTPR
jgi:hypothetical protein